MYLITSTRVLLVKVNDWPHHLFVGQSLSYGGSEKLRKSLHSHSPSSSAHVFVKLVALIERNRDTIRHGTNPLLESISMLCVLLTIYRRWTRRTGTLSTAIDTGDRRRHFRSLPARFLCISRTKSQTKTHRKYCQYFLSTAIMHVNWSTLKIAMVAIVTKKEKSIFCSNQLHFYCRQPKCLWPATFFAHPTPSISFRRCNYCKFRCLENFSYHNCSSISRTIARRVESGDDWTSANTFSGFSQIFLDNFLNFAEWEFRRKHFTPRRENFSTKRSIFEWDTKRKSDESFEVHFACWL